MIRTSDFTYYLPTYTRYVLYINLHHYMTNHNHYGGSIIEYSIR